MRIRPLLTRFAGLVGERCGFHLEIIEPQPAAGPPHPLTGLFDLTRREAEVLSMLARGHSLESLAHALSMSPHTARVHLRAIFAKTRTSRQSDLLRLCAQIGVASR